jgi:hypothetical protein
MPKGLVMYWSAPASNASARSCRDFFPETTMIGASEEVRISRAGLKSSNSRHLEIEKDQIRRLLMQFLKSLFATARIVHLESLCHQRDPQNAASLGFVVHHQNS